MKKIKERLLTSRLSRFFAFAAGFVSAYSLTWGNYGYGGVETIAVFSVLAASMAFTAVSLLRDKRGGFVKNMLTDIDYTFLIAAVAFTLYAGSIGYRFDEFRLTLSFAFYAAPYLLFAATVIKAREKKIVKTVYAVKFFKTYRPNSRVGLCVIVTAAGTAALMLNLPLLRFYGAAVAAAFAVSAAMVCALFYLMYYLAAISELYEKANEEKLKSERMKIELIANVSHDIRTPLTSIINYVDLIKRLEIKDGRLSEYLGVLDGKSQRLKTLAGSLVEASKAGAGDVRVELEEIDLTELAGQLAGEFDDAVTQAGLMFVFKTPERKVRVKADGAHLWRVMENVFNNAVKYSQPQTRVYCGVWTEGNSAVFSLKNVSREPLDISPDELTERFVREDASRTGEGSGLGLYIAKALTELMGARFVINISGDLFEARAEFAAVEAAL
ncbi:MAG: HAMP domain-containing histidine kinase [Oscillospiraceae bacterium]|jgi:signal transduction histidine kinase|nr:HAMP domain-containing histidine kinase [Oscillospiraceae bacterium]